MFAHQCWARVIFLMTCCAVLSTRHHGVFSKKFSATSPFCVTHHSFCFVSLFVVSSFMVPLGPLKGHPSSFSVLVLLLLHPGNGKPDNLRTARWGNVRAIFRVSVFESFHSSHFLYITWHSVPVFSHSD